VGRGGGPSYQGHPPLSHRERWNGSLRLTEQGEVIAAKYARAADGPKRNLETLLAATLESTLLGRRRGSAMRPGPAYEVLDDSWPTGHKRAYGRISPTRHRVSLTTSCSPTPVSEIGSMKHRQADPRRAQNPTSSIAEPCARFPGYWPGAQFAGDAAGLVRKPGPARRELGSPAADGARSKYLRDLVSAVAVLPEPCCRNMAPGAREKTESGPGRPATGPS